MGTPGLRARYVAILQNGELPLMLFADPSHAGQRRLELQVEGAQTYDFFCCFVVVPGIHG